MYVVPSSGRYVPTDLIFLLASFQISDDIINCQGGDMVAWGGNRRPSKIDIPCVVSIGMCTICFYSAANLDSLILDNCFLT